MQDHPINFYNAENYEGIIANGVILMFLAEI